MKKKERRRISAVKGLMWRISALALGIWLTAMSYLTLFVADDQYDQCDQALERYMEYTKKWGGSNFSDKYIGTDEVKYRFGLINILNHPIFYDYELNLPMRKDLKLRPERVQVLWNKFFNWDRILEGNAEYAVFTYDKNGKIDMGRDGYVYLIFDYERSYPGEQKQSGYTAVNLKGTECGQTVLKQLKTQDDRIYRLRGYFEKEEFVLVEAAYSEISLDEAKHGLAAASRENREWIDLSTGQVPDNRELVTIYPYHILCNKLDAVMKLEGKKWTPQNLADEYILHTDHDNCFICDGLTTSNLHRSVLIKWGQYLDEQQNWCSYVVVMQVRPVRIAMMLLFDIYLLTLIPLVVILLLISRRIRINLANPITHIIQHFEMNDSKIPYSTELRWREPFEFERCYIKLQNRIHDYQKEITQLNTALDYAHNAEENRRRMVSNITHELKTPLAVIHSYAEGLKEGIAADKQEHYLDVILEEAERMDGMVLEMLDLSRLEAGKVRLATDRFSLLELTRRVIDKLSLLVEEKELTVEYVWAHDCEITADEGRITQAVTNLVSNAIKYSPRGSTVHIGVTREKSQAVFSIENQSEPLSEEALAKIWDSFYRTDKSRTEKGTGLGLPITKAIIELHGGTCQVCNTTFRQENKSVTGVEFKFYLP